MKYTKLFLLILFFLASCAAPATSAPVLTETLKPELTETQTSIPTLTPTPDLCAPENLASTLKEIDDLQVQFDALSLSATQTPREQLAAKITEMQGLLQTAMDQKTPPCLIALRDHQVKHINMVISTLVAFEGGADQQAFNNGAQLARQEHDQYTVELARLSAIALTPDNLGAIPSATPTP